MGVFDEVKERVTARVVMERAGIVFNRSNMCKCPFHQDKTASMKVKPADKKYFCFGCGEKGDAIDFVAKYYNLSPKDAAMQVADEFGIAYDSSVRSPPKPVRREKSPMQILEEAKTKIYRVLSDYFHLLKEWERDFKPKSMDEIDARYEWDNEILTVGELRYRRTGSKRHPRPQLNAWYNWPDKTLYDILTRKEYLGHTITGKTYKVSYKSKKTKKNPEEKRYFFPNTHEPLIDEETFELAQKRIATRQRPTKVDEIDLFSGLLFCGDCGYKMYAVRGAGTLERKHAYTCGNYRNRARNDMLCTTHYIRKSVLKELVLADLQRVTSYVKEHEQEFIETANECSAKAVQKTLTQQRKELDKAQNRMNELNILFRKLYEDNALGKLSDEQFAFLTSGYDEEKKTLTRRIAELSQEIDNATERSADVKRFVALVRRYTAITELTYENVHEFIDRILIHELDKETNTRKIEIFYSFVGRVDTGDKPTESISYFRQIGADVKSYAI